MYRILFLLVWVVCAGPAAAQTKQQDVFVCIHELPANILFVNLIEAIRDQVYAEFSFGDAGGDEPPCHMEATINRSGLKQIKTWRDEKIGVEVRLWRTDTKPPRFVIEAVDTPSL